MDVPDDRPAVTTVSIVVFTLAGIAIKPMPQAEPWLAPPDKAQNPDTCVQSQSERHRGLASREPSQAKRRLFAFPHRAKKKWAIMSFCMKKTVLLIG